MPEVKSGRSGRPRIGVVGTGWWATEHHIPSLLAYDGCQLTALADSDSARLAAASNHFGVERTFTIAEDMLSSGTIDGVVIAVPHRDHHRLARAALEHDVHVLVEKPMTLRAAEAWELVRLATARSLHLLVGFTHQYTRAARRCQDAVQAGQIGDLLLVSGVWASATEALYRGDRDRDETAMRGSVTGPRPDTYSDPDLAGGGQAQTQLSHAGGMVTWVTGQRVDRVMAFMDNRGLEVDVVDAVSCTFANGAVGAISSTGSQLPDQPAPKELRYFGTDGHVIQDLHAGIVEIHRNGHGIEVVQLPADERYPAGSPARTLADLIAGHGYNPAPGQAGAYAVECIEAAYRAAALGRPVAVAELDDD